MMKFLTIQPMAAMHDSSTLALVTDCEVSYWFSLGFYTQ